MKQFIGGVMVGLALSGSAVLAGSMYDQRGNPAAPRGSVQQYDYFRGRALQLDVEAMRKQADRERFERNQKRPCE